MTNYNVAVREWQDQVVFLHKIVPGAADKSYGIHVARLAGVPPLVIERAKEILAQLEEPGPRLRRPDQDRPAPVATGSTPAFALRAGRTSAAFRLALGRFERHHAARRAQLAPAVATRTGRSRRRPR